jgi:hypothetical protein
MKSYSKMEGKFKAQAKTYFVTNVGRKEISKLI